MEVVLDSRKGDISRAREVTATYVARSCPWANTDDVVLVVSELVTNAVRHTTGWWRLRIRRMRGRRRGLVVDVDDTSGKEPTVRAPDLTGGGGGHGWHIVRRLATAVEVVPRPYGKTVRATWASLSRSESRRTKHRKRRTRRSAPGLPGPSRSWA
ncbi:ATP-binding protein [Streptomyces sp. NPDC051776]|uniref:ATP-binding protein n=1 Tax=Streptomyces sp. NPDC051776 TaxID=3155414 RepID=UPI0034163721